MTISIQKVGFLCSVAQPDAKKFLDAFEGTLGIRANAKHANGKYGRGDRTLVTLVKQLMDGSEKVDVIAAGSLTCLQAAVQAAKEFEMAGTPIKIPIVFIGDRIIQHANISGGLHLDMSSFHRNRVDALRSPPYGATKVGLLVNGNAAVGSDEERGWDLTWGPVQPVGRNEDNDHINLQQAIDQLLSAGANGIIIASDPFLTSKRKQLVSLLNRTDKPVCYPFDSYKDDVGPGQGPTTGKSLRFGVNLEDQYRALGTKAKRVLEAPAGTIPDVGVDVIQSAAVHW